MKKKSKFLTLLFSCYPGGGHMYLGFMKQGVQLMLLFSVVAAIASLGYLFNGLGFFIPILIAYSIFDAMNKRGSEAQPDDSDLELFKWFNIENTGKLKAMNYHKVGVYVLIIAGAYILIDNVGVGFLRILFGSRFGDRMHRFYLIERVIKSSVLGVLFIVGGLKLQGKLKEMDTSYENTDEIKEIEEVEEVKETQEDMTH